MELSPYLLTDLMMYRGHLRDSFKLLGSANSSVHNFDVEFTPGKKYIHVVTVSHGHRSSHSFIDEAGTIWKSASRKGPAKNFPRGNVSDPSTWGQIYWNGIYQGN